MATLEKEDFWVCELKKGSNEVKFNPQFEDSELSEVEHKLVLSQACLGAKPSGRCLVEVTSLDYKGDECKSVIVSLQLGSNEMCPLNLSFSPPTSFKLIEGSGPVHLTGNHIQSLTEEDLDSSDDSDEEEVPILIDSKKDTKNKRPLPSSIPSGPSKKMKKDEDDEEEKSSEEEVVTSKPASAKKDSKQEPKKPSKPDTKDEEESDDDDEDDEDYDDEDDEDDDDEDEGSEEDSDDDDDEEDEDKDDEEESDEEESDEITKTLTAKKDSPKKPLTNGVASKKGDKKTPSKPQQKTPQQKTPQQKTPTVKPVKDLDTIKQALLKSPALPKKMDKFKNLLRSSYKITDEETAKEVWDFVQKNKK